MVQERLKDVFQIDAQVMMQYKADATCTNQGPIIFVQIMAAGHNWPTVIIIWGFKQPTSVQTIQPMCMTYPLP